MSGYYIQYNNLVIGTGPTDDYQIVKVDGLTSYPDLEWAEWSYSDTDGGGFGDTYVRGRTVTVQVEIFNGETDSQLLAEKVDFMRRNLRAVSTADLYFKLAGNFGEQELILQDCKVTDFDADYDYQSLFSHPVVEIEFSAPYAPLISAFSPTLSKTLLIPEVTGGSATYPRVYPRYYDLADSTVLQSQFRVQVDGNHVSDWEFTLTGGFVSETGLSITNLETGEQSFVTIVGRDSVIETDVRVFSSRTKRVKDGLGQYRDFELLNSDFVSLEPDVEYLIQMISDDHTVSGLFATTNSYL